MADQQAITVNGEPAGTIELRPVTLVVPAADMACHRIGYPGCVQLTTEVTVYHAERVRRLHGRFAEFWLAFMRNTSPATPVDYEVTADRIRQMGTGAVHLMGLIDMTLKLTDKAARVVWVYPESFLHPGWQVALGDLAIKFGMGD